MNTIKAKIINRLVLFASLLLFGLPLARADTAAFKIYSEKFVLDNGLTVVVSELPTSPMVSVYGLIQTGSARSGQYVGSGISHFLEHMLFKGTHEREVGEIASQIQAVGGSINASTGHDFTMYTINVPHKHFELALDVLTDMLFEATIDADEAEKEREVIFAEMRLQKDDPGRWLTNLSFQNAYRKHPYQHPIIGYKDLLAKISRDDLYQYYKTRYAPNNMILSVAGNVRIEDVRPKIEQKLGSLERQAYPMDLVPEEPVQLTPRRFVQEYPTDLARISMTYQGISLHNEDLFALDVLAQILGQGQSSRLYQNLYKEKQIVYSIRAYNFTPLDKGLFQITALSEADDLEALEQAVTAQIEDIQTKGVTKEELKKAKRQVLSDYIQGSQKASSVAWHHALDESFTGDHTFSEKYVQRVKEIAREDIQRVARKYLAPERLTVTILRPEEGQKDKQEPVKKTQGEIQKHTLENGLTVLLRRDPTFPLTSIRLLQKGGLLTEPEGLSGISALMSHVWIKGTRSMSAEEIERETESLGMDISSFSGKNSFGININLLAQDIDFALELLEDIVEKPTFDKNEIDRKKQDMFSAIVQRKENIFPLTAYTLKQQLYPDHPYQWDTNGTKESLGRMTREDVASHYSRHFSPENMVLAIFGDIQPEAVLEKVRGSFGGLKKKEFRLPHKPVEVFDSPKHITNTLNKEQAMVMIGFHGVDLFSKDRYALEVAEAILGSSFSGRLFQSVREKLGKAYTMGGASIPGWDRGYVFFYVLTENESVPKVEEIMKEEIARLAQQPVPVDELKDIKTYLKGTFKAGLETNASVAFTSGLQELYGLGFDHFKEYDSRIDAVDAQAVQNAARTYLNLDKAVTVVTRPEKISE